MLSESRPDIDVEPASLFHARTLRRRSRLLLRHARSLLGNDPVFLPVVLRATPRGTSRRITPDTDIVVEGYPRSGNTFAAAALRTVGGSHLVVASHVHTPSQVVLAVRRRLPTIVVVRRPAACVASLVIAAPHVPPALALREWADHYRRLWTLRDDFVIATFDQTTENFGGVIDRVNEKWGLAIPRFMHDADHLARVETLMTADHDQYHLGDERSAPWPVSSRNAAREWLDHELASTRYRSLLDVADTLFERYATAADHHSA